MKPFSAYKIQIWGKNKTESSKFRKSDELNSICLRLIRYCILRYSIS